MMRYMDLVSMCFIFAFMFACLARHPGETLFFNYGVFFYFGIHVDLFPRPFKMDCFHDINICVYASVVSNAGRDYSNTRQCLSYNNNIIKKKKKNDKNNNKGRSKAKQELINFGLSRLMITKS